MNGPEPQTVFTPQDGKTVLMVKQSPMVYTARRDTDCHMALTRGLKEYLEQLSFNSPDGQVSSLRAVFDVWAEPEDIVDYPSAIVDSEEEGIYEDSAGFTPNLSPDHRVADPSDGRYVVTPNGFQLDMTIEIRATSPEERMRLVSMVEDAMDPVDWRSGALLELPHYFGQRATYKKMKSKYADDSTAALQRLRVAKIIVRGNVPETRLEFRPTMVVRRRVEVGTTVLATETDSLSGS